MDSGSSLACAGRCTEPCVSLELKQIGQGCERQGRAPQCRGCRGTRAQRGGHWRGSVAGRAPCPGWGCCAGSRGAVAPGPGCEAALGRLCVLRISLRAGLLCCCRHCSWERAAWRAPGCLGKRASSWGWTRRRGVWGFFFLFFCFFVVVVVLKHFSLLLFCKTHWTFSE